METLRLLHRDEVRADQLDVRGSLDALSGGGHVAAPGEDVRLRCGERGGHLDRSERDPAVERGGQGEVAGPVHRGGQEYKQRVSSQRGTSERADWRGVRSGRGG